MAYAMLQTARFGTADAEQFADGFHRAARHDERVAAAIWSARIERAWRLLTSAEGTGMMISDIAADCGFREVPTFTRVFRRLYGVTPGEARGASARAT